MKLKIICWNVSELNEKKKRKLLRLMVTEWDTCITCFVETKLKSADYSLFRQTGGSRWIKWKEIEAQGHSGGILLFWDKRRCKCDDKLMVLHSDTGFLEELNTGFKLMFTGVYGPFDRKKRGELWQELDAIRG